jgi:methionine biosynthesis protein MetW
MKIKDKKYYSVERGDLIGIVPSIYGSVLDVGCGAGATMAILKAQGVKDVVGIEYIEAAYLEAIKNGLDVIKADIEKDVIVLAENHFDFIIFADILEHLYDPWETLKKFRKFLKNDGTALISIPNMKHYRVLKKLLFRDEWTYTEFGILDSTHIRFFTKTEAIKLVELSGFDVVGIVYKTRNNYLFKFISLFAENFAMTLWPEQFFIAAKKRQSNDR